MSSFHHLLARADKMTEGHQGSTVKICHDYSGSSVGLPSFVRRHGGFK